MLVQMSNFLPGLPPMSIVTAVGICIMAVSLLMYLVNPIRELLLITLIAFIYAAVPVIGMIHHA